MNDATHAYCLGHVQETREREREMFAAVSKGIKMHTAALMASLFSIAFSIIMPVLLQCTLSVIVLVQVLIAWFIFNGPGLTAPPRLSQKSPR